MRVEAAAELLRASIELRLRRNASSLLGEPDPEEPAPLPRDRLREAKLVGYAVGAAADRLPWHPTCLRQALAVQRMLLRRGIRGRLHLGVVTGGEAHAWVTVGGRTVIGAGERDRFVPLAAFGQR